MSHHHDEECSGAVRPQQAGTQASDPSAGCMQSTPTVRLLTHAEEQALEVDAKNALYRATAQFVMEPNRVNATMVEIHTNSYRDAWMRGRRRVMD